MKKNIRFLSMMFVVATLLLVCGCALTNSKAINSEDFTKAVEDRGLTVNDITADGVGFEQTEGKLKTALLANGAGYQFVYVEITDETAAKAYFDNLVELFKTDHPNGSTINGNINGNREFSCEDGEAYFKSVQKKGIVVTAVVDGSSGKEEVKAIFKKMGY